MRHVILSLLLATLCTGCIIVPIPHRRLHGYGVRGSVVDAGSGRPIPYAAVSGVARTQTVICSATGDFVIAPVHGWHGAYLIGPISLSLFPGWDMTAPWAALYVTAGGYVPETFQVTGKIQGESIEVRPLRLRPERPRRLELPKPP